MTRTMLEVAALFAGYAAVGATGDLAAAAMSADEIPVEVSVRVDGTSAPTAVVSVEAAEAVAQVARDVGVRVADHADQECVYSLEHTGAVAASAEDRVVVDAGSGHLRVEGRAGLSEVRVVGLACASHESYLTDLRVTLERRGGDVEVRSHYPESRDRDRGSRNVARLDLVVEVPLGAAVDIDDSSGAIEVYSVGPLRIDDSSGEILVQGVDGDLVIDDSSGDVEVREVTGDATIDDSSGDVDVSDVRGSLRLQDGSGSIHAEAVVRDVVVEADGSGSITVRDVGGDFRVLRDGSGGIRHSGVQGQVDIPVKKGRRGRN